MKKIIVIASVILICIIIILLLVSQKKSTTSTSSNSPFPTSISLQKSNQQNSQLLNSDSASLTGTENNNQNLSDSSTENNNQGLTNLPIDNVDQNLSDPSFDISTIAPVETEDFRLQYSSKLNKIVVERKTPQAEEQFAIWASQNQLTQLVENPDLTIIVDQGENPIDFNPFFEFLNIFINFGQGVLSSTEIVPTGQVVPSSILNPQESITPPIFSGEKVYYAQCNGYGNISLPDGCTLCYAGCGPTTVAMIAASYLGTTSYNPKTIVDTYDSEGYLLGCSGSRYTDAYTLLKNLGLKTTDYLVFNLEKADTVVPQLRGYLNAGWTFFTLASFCDGGCGHFFWITDIDSDGNIFAYDPAYGRYQIPYNENSRYPFPLYRLAFGVKK